MAIPDNVLEKAGEMGAQATQNAANLSQSPDAHWYDVWTQTGEGMLSPPALSPFIPAPGEAMTPEVARRIKDAKAAASDWQGANLTGVADGLEQQANTIKEQAAQIWDAKTANGQPMSTLQRVGAAFGLLTSVEQFYSVLWTSWIPFPAFPALRVMDIDVGLPHAHMHPPNLIPPNPVPVPLPSTGPVIPIPFLSGASKTLINAMPAARCGDMGLGVFCGGFFPMYEVFLGSSSVWIEGNRAGRLGVDITKHCIFSAPKPSDPPVGPMFGTTVMGSPNVMIGGVPLPSLTSMAIGAAFKAVFKGAGKLIGAARKRLGKAKPPVRARSGNTPSADPRLSGPPLLRLPFTRVDPAKIRDWIAKMGQAPNLRIILPKGSKVSLEELRVLTARTGKEWGVVLNDRGRLVLVGGEAGELSGQLPTDHLLAHTHPKADGSYMTNISDGDLTVAQNQHAAGKPSSQVAVTNDGVVHAFDHNGVNATPQTTPVGPNGEIDGRYYEPDGTLDAEPPVFDNHPPST